MNRKTKLALSILGIGAVVVPAILLVVATSKAPEESQISGGKRTIDAKSIEDAVKKTPQRPTQYITPVASGSASPSISASPGVEGSGTAKPR